MVDPIKLAGQDEQSLEELAAAIEGELQMTDRLPNLADKVRHLEGALRSNVSARRMYPRDSTLLQREKDIKDLLFELRNSEGLIQRIEERLGQDVAEPVDLTLQQTLDVMEQLRRLSETIPNDERLATVATNVCEGLESFVSAVLAQPTANDNGGAASIGAGPGDLTMALEVINTIQTCPGADRRASVKNLHQQFIDAACRSAWSRVNQLFDTGLDRPTRKEYLHEALSIWTLLPDLSENAGSPRLSQLPDDIRRTIQQVLLREVIGTSAWGDRRGLLDAALLANELAEDYLTMIPAISVSDAQARLGLEASDTLIRRLKSEIASSASWADLELCLSVISVLRTFPGMEEDQRLDKLSRPIRTTTWRLRVVGAVHAVRRSALSAFAGLVGLMAVGGAYIGVAILIERLYDYGLPLAP